MTHVDRTGRRVVEAKRCDLTYRRSTASSRLATGAVGAWSLFKISVKFSPLTVIPVQAGMTTRTFSAFRDFGETLKAAAPTAH